MIETGIARQLDAVGQSQAKFKLHTYLLTLQHRLHHNE